MKNKIARYYFWRAVFLPETVLIASRANRKSALNFSVKSLRENLLETLRIKREDVLTKSSKITKFEQCILT